MLERALLALSLRTWRRQRADFYLDLADALRRKLLLRAFVEQELDNCRITRSASRARVLRTLLLHVGEPRLSRVLAHVMPRSDQTLLLAVDAARDKPAMLEQVASNVRRMQGARAALLRKLATPALMLPLLGFIAYTIARAITELQTMMPADTFTGLNALVRALAIFIVDSGQALALGVVALAAVVALALPRWTGRLRRLADRSLCAPWRDWHATQVLSALAALLSSGMLVREAIEALRPRAQPWLAWQLLAMLRAFDATGDLALCMDRGLFGPHVRARFASLRRSADGPEAALVTLGANEADRLIARFEASAHLLGVGLTTTLVLIAMFLTLGLVSIAATLFTGASAP